MADILCYKCGSVIPAGSERCLNCGAPAPLPEEDVDKRKLRERATFGSDGSVHFNMPKPGYQPQPDEATSLVMPGAKPTPKPEPEGHTTIIHPTAAPDGATRVVRPEPEGHTTIIHPTAAPDGATRIVQPEPEGHTTIIHPTAAPDGATRIVQPEPEGHTTIIHPTPAPDGATRIVQPQTGGPTTIMQPTGGPQPSGGPTQLYPGTPTPQTPPTPPQTPQTPQTPKTPKSSPAPSASGRVPWPILIILAVLIAGGLITYFVLAGNDEDNAADRYYALVTVPLYEAPSETSALVDSVAFGGRFLVYGSENGWSHVKYLPTNGSSKKGYVQSRMLINNGDMLRLTNLLTTNAVLAAFPEAVHRRALIDFMNAKGYGVPGEGDSIANPNPWRLRLNRGATPSGYNEVYTGRTFKRDSRYPDLGIILRPVDIDNENLLLYYTFDENGVPRQRVERTIGSDNCIIGASRGEGLSMNVQTEYVGL